jgi:hypothetical protein
MGLKFPQLDLDHRPFPTWQAAAVDDRPVTSPDR